ncbi:hypothetical protein OSI79_04855, partial [Mycobacterium ulcerans]
RRPHLRGFVMAAQPRQSWSSCDLSGPDTPGPIRPLTPLPRQSPALAVIEAAMELPELGGAGVTNFLDVQGIELRDTPPRSSFDRRGAGDGRQAERSPACRLRGLFRDRGVRASDR